MKYSIGLLLTLLLPALLVAQRPRPVAPELFVIAKYGPDATQLRWGYGDVDSWVGGFRETATIYRRRVGEGATPYEVLDTVRILPEAELEALAATAGGMTGVILSMAYQEWENSQYSGQGDDFMEKRDNLNNRHALFHYAADRDPRAARAAGLAYTDTTREPGVTYAYRIVTGGPKTGIGTRVVPAVVANARPLIHRAQNRPGAVVLSWEREIHDKMFSGYFVERSAGETGPWLRLNELPYVQGYDGDRRDPPRFYTYTDSLAVGAQHRYRLVGLDPFGAESAPSPYVVVRGTDLTPPPAPVLVADQLEQLHLQKKLTWTQPPGEAVTSYHLERRFADRRELVIDFAGPGDTVQIDQLSEPGAYHYRLIAQDAAGNLAWSDVAITRVLDREAPTRPTGLTAEADTTGRIVLTWDAPEERDVIGYYVFARDGDRRAFRRITNQIHRSRRYVDTVSTALMNEYRYYYIQAIDQDYLYSHAGDTLRVERPDISPPNPALISDFSVHDGAVRLSFRPSNSRNVAYHALLRRTPDVEVWDTVGRWERPPFFYYDSTVVADATYRYAYQATSRLGRTSSIVSELQVSTRRATLAPPQLTAESRDFRVVLSWEANGPARAWQIYRSEDGGPEQRLVTLTEARATYSDARTQSGKTYRYRLRLIRPDGRRSPFSEPVNITL